jgi:hypothetical protein
MVTVKEPVLSPHAGGMAMSLKPIQTREVTSGATAEKEADP